MDFAEGLRILQLVVTILAMGGAALAGVWAWGARKAVQSARLAAAAGQVPALKERLDEQHVEMTDMRGRVRTLEQALAQVPTREAIADIRTLLERLEGKINTNTVRTESAAKSADAAMEACNRIEGFFIEKGVAR